MKVAHFKMVVPRVNRCYLTREAVRLVLNEGLDLKDFSEFGSGKEFVLVDQVTLTALITSSTSSLGSMQPVE